MALDLPPEIDVRATGDGVRYVLPSRELGKFHLIGLLLMAFGAVFTVGPLAGFAGFTGPWGAAGTGPLFAVVIAGVLAIPFVLVGLLVIAVGLFVLAGHSEIDLNARTICGRERAGPIAWARKRPMAALEKLKVEEGVKTPQGSVNLGPLANLSAITAMVRKGKPLLLAPGYPRAWLRPLADDIARQAGSMAPAGPLTRTPGPLGPAGPAATIAPITVIEETGEEDAAPPVKPVDSTVTLAANADGITIEIPPAGLLRGSRGLFVFGLLWNGFMALVTVMFSVGLINGSAGTKTNDLWFIILFIGLFWVIGGVLVLAAINMGRRRAIIDVVGDALLINRKNIFGIKSHEWLSDELVKITVGSSGMEVNDVPVLELQIHPRAGRAVGLFAGRRDDELRWIAAELTQALRL